MRIAVAIEVVMAVNIGASLMPMLTEPTNKVITAVITNEKNDSTTEINNYSCDEQLLALAEEYATKQIPNVQNQQDYWYQHNSDGAAESSVEIVSARVETFEYMLTYNGYIIYKYNGSFKSNDPEDIFSIDEWELRDDGWYTDL